MTLTGKTVAIFVAEYYEDMEFWYPRYRMIEEGAAVVVIGARLDTFHSKHGIPAEADLAASDASVDAFDVLIIPGGYAPDHMRRSPDMVAFTRNLYLAGKTVAAICHGGWMLVSARILEGRKATSFYSIKDDLTNSGAQWVDEPVVRDGTLITSRFPADLPAFCRTIIETVSRAGRPV